jgi:nucleoid-associated protein YgaU
LKPEPADGSPRFDVARIEPNGEAVIAGQAAPGAAVELLQDGKVHDRTVADSSGAFVLVPRPLPSGNYDLTLRTTDPDGKARVSDGSVAVTLDSSKKEKPVAALTGPKAPPAAPQSKPAADPEARVQIVDVRAEDGGRLHVSGRSVPGSSVRLYLNDAYIAAGTASSDGRVEFSIRGGVKPGKYQVRLDQLNASGKVLSRVETAFIAPMALAEAKPSEPVESPAPPPPAEAKSSEPAESPAPRRQLEASPPSPASEAPSQSAHAVERDSSPSKAPRAGEADQQVASSQREHASAPVNQTPPQAPVTNEASSEPRSPQETRPVVATGPANQREVVVVPNIHTRVVIRGDSLWRISQSTYGHGKLYPTIYSANRNKIRDPDLIYPDQIFVLPNALPQ